MEMMRVRILIYVCALLSCDVQTHIASVKDSSEQSALQEALLLVELLKSEYSRVLREKSSTKEDEIDDKDLQTCATTTAPTDVVTHTPTDITIRHIEQSSTAEALKLYTTHGPRRFYHPGYRARSSPRHGQRPPQAVNYYDYPRRRFINYPDYYGGYGPAKPWRRRDYENVFGPRPGRTIATSTVSHSTTVSVTNSSTDTTLSSISTTASTTVSEMSTSSNLSHTPSSSTIHLSTTVSSTIPKSVTLSVTTLKPTIYRVMSSSLPKLISVLNIKQPSLISKRALSLPSAINKKSQTKKRSVSEKVKQQKSLSVKKTTVISTYEPEQAQVAAELENELEEAIESSTSLPSSSSHRQPITWRPSTRVHMAKSTPYHIPLPENHAFCFTNPESALCRTFIK